MHELREVITAAVLGAAAGERMTVAIGVVRLQVRDAGRARSGARCPLHPQSVFRSRVAPADRARSRGARLHQWRSPRRAASSTRSAKLLEFLLPLYQREGRSYLTIGLGCTGGRHRSPMLAKELKERLAAKGYAVEVRHHDLMRLMVALSS